ncbi:ArsI/CadI family heavy metal resistance metalloenzyme [Acaryochloris sp. IP29b_bin.137]|uniref:ArsI/CadI family heavy metal resistance metalloenzyme n=1 Tax=Acaryochloris sp. IP29b_bin.137 TaxID=2969217 RepID=UPI00263276A2|nr:ArsI/CadI family heavy metal resistance metalloenzyme [Acaryochloris sp. IP29b_bin.137]
MSRLQLALNVKDLETAVSFYSKLFATEPAKRQPGYANFAIANPPIKLVLFENPTATHKLNHLGIEVESSEQVAQAGDRLRNANLPIRREEQTTCCYAVQDKVWVTDTDGDDWEIYTVLEDAETLACSPSCP